MHCRQLTALIRSFTSCLELGALAWSCCALIGSSSTAFAEDIDLTRLPPPASEPIDFVQQIKPVLESSCLRCHHPGAAKSGFILATRADALKGGERGVDVIPGNSEKSALIHFIAGLVPDVEMPPRNKGTSLSDRQIGLLRAWIDQGVNWPTGVVLTAPGVTQGSSRADSNLADPPCPTENWSFHAPLRPAFPTVRKQDWVRNPIDQFILARLEADGLAPSPEGDRVT